MADRGAPAPLVVIGPSGSGKTTLVQALLKRRTDLELVPTWTTRPRRARETVGHVFVDDETFDSGHFLGTVDVFGQRYGLPQFTSTARPLLLLRVFVLDQLVPLFPYARVVQVEAPFDVLERRLRQRGDDDRVDEQKLAAEVEAGRAFAHAIVVADASLDENLTRFEAGINTALG
ncbi:MAG: hypothetical protein FWD63_05025 [Propionibacteriaceae bacterium]|nr:hypothetical protein [Propionibacteriaceae bacterium]